MANPNPSRIAPATWQLWKQTSAAMGSIQLGGIYANKRGYHNTRAANPSNDYSRQYAADLRGPSDKSAAVDWTFPEAHGRNYTRIRDYTMRLVNAARNRDPRLYRNGTPVIREVIGNFPGYANARAYDLQTRSESQRDNSHLWHIHVSITREFVNNSAALGGVASVMVGGSPQMWEQVFDKVDPNSGTSDRMRARNFLVHTHYQAVEANKKLTALPEQVAAAVWRRTRVDPVTEEEATYWQILRAIREDVAEQNSLVSELMGLVSSMETGELAAEEVVRLIGERLTEAA